MLCFFLHFFDIVGLCFKLLDPIKPPPISTGGEFPIGQEQLASISREHDTAALQQHGGVCLPKVFFLKLVMVLFSVVIFQVLLLNHYQVVGVSNLLKTNLEKGIHGDDADLLKRRNAFGSNNYPRKKGRSFLVTLFIKSLMIIRYISFFFVIGDIVVTFLFFMSFTDVYVGCLQGPDLGYFNDSCSSFIGTWDKI